MMARPTSIAFRRGEGWRARTVTAIVACAIEGVWAQTTPGIPLAWPTAKPAQAAEFTSRSVLFDAKRAEEARAREQPVFVESIVVEGRDPDARRRPPKPLEQRFAEALLAPAPSSTAGLRFLDTTPCMSLQSTWNTIGNSYAPLTGCP
jgi:hypothetical protein